MLNQASLNPIQAWALEYWLYMERRIALDDKADELDLQTLYLFPERWEQMQKAKESNSGDWGQAFGGEAEIPVTDLDEIKSFDAANTAGGDLEAFYRNVDQPRQMSGADVSRMLGYAPPGATGRRV